LPKNFFIPKNSIIFKYNKKQLKTEQW